MRILSVLAFCGIFAACSATKGTASYHFEPVQLTEEQQLKYDFDFIEATRFKLLGNLPYAANLFTRCTEVNPYAAAAHYQLSQIYTIIDDRYHALKYARLANRYDPENQWYKLQLANIYLSENKIDSAIVVYRKIVESQPLNADLRYNMAFLYLENNQNRRALRELDKIEKIYGFTEELAIAKYSVHSQRGRRRAIEAVLKKGIKMYPEELRFYGLLAEHYSSIGREKDAQEYYTKLLEIDPENALGYISMIEFFKDYGNDAKALEGMQHMFNMRTIDPEFKVELYLQLSEDSVFFRKHHKEMDMMVKQLFEKYPDNFRVRLINTDRNMRESNYEGARDDLLFITNRVQTNYLLWEHLFHLLYYLNDYETLYESTAKALQYFDDRYLFNFFHGYSATMLKRYDVAVSAYFSTLDCMEKERVTDIDVLFQTYVFLAEACNEQRRFQETSW